MSATFQPATGQAHHAPFAAGHHPIWLARHLLCEIDITPRLSASEFVAWSASYDKAGVTGQIPSELADLVARGGVVVTSHLPRALQTAALAGCPDPVVEPALARIPRPRMPFPVLRMRPLTWRGLGRLLWLLGWSAGTENRRSARARAVRAAERLIELARHREVIVIGHGYQNQMVAQELRRRGWRGPRLPPKRPGFPTRYDPPPP